MLSFASYLRLILLFSLVAISTCNVCEREDSWGRRESFSCPEYGDNFNERYCCGFSWNQRCCSNQDLDELDDFASKGVMHFVGVVIGCLFIFCFLATICCCCCCPCCWLAKRRTQGAVHGPGAASVPLNPPVAQPKTQTIYTMQPPAPNQPYPQQTQAYTPQQPPYPPQQGYPPQQPPPAYGYPPQDTGYPPVQPPPYPGPPQSQDFKQPAFNPNAS